MLGRRLGRARRGLSAEENWAAALGPVRSCAGCLGQGGLDRHWALAGKGRKVGPDRAEREIGQRGKGMEEKGWPASGFGGLTGLGLVSGFSPFLSLFFSNTLKLI